MSKTKVTLMFFLLLTIIPFQVEAEDTEQEEKRSGLLSNTVNNLLGTTEEIVDSVQETVTEVEKSVPVLKPVTNVVSEVEKVTLPVVHDVVTGVTEATDSTLSGVVEGVGKTFNRLPEIPVVTPVLNKTTETLDAVTSDVQTIVDTSEETVGNIVNIVVEEKLVQTPALVTKPDIKPTTISTTTGEKPSSNNSEQEVSEEAKQPAKEQVIDATVVEVPVPAQPIIDTIVSENESTSRSVPLRVEDDESFYPGELTDSNEKGIKLIEKDAKKQTVKVPVIPAIPLGPEQKMIINSGAAWSGQKNVSSTGLSFLNSGNDVLQGFLPSDEMLKELTKKKWYHQNSYAIVQWIHTPLRKPPEATPFLYVI